MRNFACLSLGLCLGSLLFAGDAPAQSQLDVRTSNVSQLAGADGPRTIGDVVLLTDVETIEFTAGVLIEVTSPAANVEIEVTDRDRRRVDYTALAHENGTTYYLVTQEGKAWVDVTAIDFASNIYKRSTGNVIEVKAMPLPGPAPSPTPTLPEPTGSLLGLCKSLADKLSSDKAKASSLSSAFLGFSDAVRVIPIASVQQFNRVVSESIRSLGVPSTTPVGRDIEDIIATHVGIQRNEQRQWLDRPLTQADRDKAAEAFMAIAWAGAQVK